MLPFHCFHTSAAPKKSITAETSQLQQKQRQQQARRYTVGTAEELSASSSSSSWNESHKSELKRSKSWYGPRDLIKRVGEIFELEGNRPKKEKKNLLKRALNIITEACPDDNLEEFLADYIHPLKIKMKQTSILIGICGQHESGKKTLIRALEHLRYTNVLFKLCPTINCPPVNSKQYEKELASCSAYLCVINCSQLDSLRMDTSFLEILLKRDKGIFNQRRALIIANKFDTCLVATGQHLTLAQNPSRSCTPSTNSEYMHYERLQDCEDLEQIVKGKIKGHIQSSIGVNVPDSCICPVMLHWAIVAREHYCNDAAGGPEILSQLTEWLELYKLFGEISENAELSTIFEEITRFKEIESWIMQHTENIDSLRELSLLSDVIHCVQYCTDKLLNELELAKIQIEYLETLKIQKEQLISECNSYQRQLEYKSRNHSLFTNNLTEAYNTDIKEPLVSINELANNLLVQFQQASEEKLKRLKNDFEYVSIEGLLETFEIDIDTFSNGAGKRLRSILRSVKFQKMLDAIPIQSIVEDCLELTKLAEHVLHEQTALEMTSSMLLEDTLHDRARSCTIGLEFFHPIMYDAISQETDDQRTIASHFHPFFYSMLLHYSVSLIPDHPLQKEELEVDYQTDFRKHCEQYLLSEELKHRAVQFYINRIIEYTSDFLAKFDQNYWTSIDTMMKKIDDRIATLKQLKDNNELKLKKLVTLKVDLEMEKALLLTNYYY